MRSVYFYIVDKVKAGEVLVIDLFAGPGGLGEGISSCQHENGSSPFQIGLSVEKDPHAHRTLTTRAFFRKVKGVPGGLDDYYEYVRGNLSREALFQRYPEQAREANIETLEGPKELGVDNNLIHERIRELTGKHSGPTVVIGGPPCQAYSLAGRSRNAGIKNYKAEKDSRNFLYLQYLKVLSIAKPNVFIMENVRGILSAKLNGKVMFPQLLKDLRSPSRVTKVKGGPKYKIYSLVVKAEKSDNPQYKDTRDFLIKSEEYGVPQARHRVILIGIREDIKATPSTLEKANDTISVESVLSDLPPLRSGFSKKTENEQQVWTKLVSKNSKYLKKLLRKSRLYSSEIIDDLDIEPVKKLERVDSQHENIDKAQLPSPLKEWLLDGNLNCVLNHDTRGHMGSDLLRYAFCAVHAKLNNGISPKSKDFPKELAPNHKNWESGDHADRFRVQSANKFATTITSHISKDGHYFVHYDPKQCRSLTVREAARLQTFPDNYFFEGGRTHQYVQVGNAVPPFLAKQIGHIVLTLISKISPDENNQECRCG